MKLVLAEKPKVGAAIAGVLGCRENHRGFRRGNGYIVTWAIGHLVEIAEPEEMNPSWARPARLEQLPMLPEPWHYRISDNTKDQFKVVAELLRDPSVTELIAATDAGREGEHIWRLIYEKVGVKKPVRRLWVSSLTPKAIRAGFDRLQPAAAFDGLAAAARCRAHADWLIGMNFSRAYTVKNGDNCTVGRVQTPTLALLVQRRKELAAFVKGSYWELHALFSPEFRAKLLNAQGRIAELERAEVEPTRAALSSAKSGRVTSVDSQPRKEHPPALYDLLTLQQDANNRFGLTAAETLATAQSLYDEYKVITYPRTECRHIAEDQVAGLPDVVRGVPDEFEPARGQALERLAAGPPLSKLYVDETKLTDHHAIIPTGVRPESPLPPIQAKLFRLIVERFLCIFQPDALYQETTVLVDVAGRTFRARDVVTTDPGWTRVFAVAVDEDDAGEKEPEPRLPSLAVGQEVTLQKLEAVERHRQPPKLYTDATLLRAMKSAGELVDDKDLAAHMKASGLGTPATRAAIIERLLKVGYALRRGRRLDATDKGVGMIDQVEPELRDVALTARNERDLAAVESGELAAVEFERRVCEKVVSLIPRVNEAPAIAVASAGGLSCPSCKQGFIKESSKAFGCNRWKEGCKFTIWKTVAGKALTVAQVEQLVTQGRTRELKGFTGKKGKFSAALKLDVATGKVEFVFAERRSA